MLPAAGLYQRISRVFQWEYKEVCLPAANVTHVAATLPGIDAGVGDCRGYGCWAEFFCGSVRGYAGRHRDTDDHITASFEPMESDAAVEERASRVESVETTWESDEECPVFGHEVEMIKDAAARMIPPNRVNKCIGLCYRNWGQLHQIGHKKFCCV